MTKWAAAFERASAGLDRLGLPARLPQLHATGLRISRQVLGGSHSVAVYPPIDSLVPVDPATVIDAIDPGRETSLYLHIPFCETRCTFCHYAVQHYPGKGLARAHDDTAVTLYLAALHQEIAMWGAWLARAGTRVSSIYIGGGTPLILEQRALGELLTAIGDAFDVVPGAELCIEGSPLSITAPDGEDTLRFLRARGVTRLSFGVQSFDDAVLKHAARGYKRDVAIRAAEIAAAVFANWNLDLIQGLYRGSPFETWENLKVIGELRPPHLTWYHGRFADRPQRDWYKSDAKHGGFEDEQATLLGRMLIWQQMAALGYQQTDGNRFVRERQHVDPFKTIRTTASRNLIGLGSSAYSRVGGARSGDGFGYLFRNDSAIPAYVDRVSAGVMPITTGRRIDDAEMLATSYATGLRHGRIEDDALAGIRTREPALTQTYHRLTRSLVEVGVLAAQDDDLGQTVLRLTDLGRLFEDETLALFFSPAVRDALAQRTAAEGQNARAGPIAVAA
ncbi:radical SAM protein [Sphingomonas sp. PB2P19]|uniref:radical SAM protein n=1 Tax=Sphingomonas rhamnosi TaxID=3096156 RepID=UPI002FC65AF2